MSFSYMKSKLIVLFDSYQTFCANKTVFLHDLGLLHNPISNFKPQLGITLRSNMVMSMGFSYMKSKFALFDSCRTFCSNKMTFPHDRGLIHNPISNFKPQLGIILRSNKVMSMFRVMCFLGAKQLSTLRFHQFGRTIYNANPYPLYIPVPRSLIPRGARWLTTISQKCSGRKGLFLGSLILVTILFGRIERIPYSRRFHCVLFHKIDKIFGKVVFKTFMIKEGYKNDILPPTDPKCIRAGLITRDIIQALHSGLGIDREFSVTVNGCKVTDLSRDNTLCESNKFRSSFGARKKSAEVTIYKNEHACKQIGQNGARKPLNWKPATRHLNKEKWEVTVIDSYEDNAVCFPDGSIVVFGGVVDRYRSDASIAATIGHEVGHAVSRHGAEALMKILLLLYVVLIVEILDLAIPDIGKLPKLALLWIQRRRELEADYIGLMLMASAGYDPREAPKSFHPEYESDSTFSDILSTHPSDRKRVKLLNKAMEEALAVYNEVRAGCGVRSFI